MAWEVDGDEIAQRIVHSAPVAIIVLDATAHIDHVNPFLEQRSGWTLAELRGKDWFDVFVSEEDREHRRELFRRRLSGSRPPLKVRSIRTRAGETVLLEGSDELLSGPNGEPVGLVIVGHDVTDRVRIEHHLKHAQSMARVGSWERDLTTNHVWWSDEMFHLLGLPPHETPPSFETFLALIPAEERAAVLETFQKGLADGEPYEIAHRIESLDGKTKHIRDRISFATDKQGRPLRSQGTILDVSEHVEAELRLRQRKARLSAVFNHTSDAMLLLSVDKDGKYRVAAANRSFEKWASPLRPGVTEAMLLGLTLEEVANDVFARPDALSKHLERVQHVASTRTQLDFEHTVAFPTGPKFAEVMVVPVLDDGGECVHVLWSSRDVTERVNAEQARVKLEAKLRQAAKMEAVGRLAGGVAHDFNNLLSVILSYCELTMRGLHATDPLRKEIGEIGHAGERAAELTRQLLAFSRQQVSSPRVMSLNTVLSGMEPMLRRLIGEDIELRVLTEPSLWLCKIDPGQVEQIVMNLIVNARDAIEGGGAITLETGNVVLDEAYVQDHPDAMTGPHAVLAITDTGAGMEADVLAHIFEPFFTTKATGVGTGLGLATVYGIVRQAGGNIWVYSEPDKGTTFKVYLPRVEGSPAEAEGSRPAIEDLRGTETILLVEDDDAVRRVVRGILVHSGYHVIDATNGGEALLVCEQHGATISLLLTDVVMPRLNGRKLAERLQQARPDLKVLFMSGYTENSIVHDGVLDSGIQFLSKPITPDALLRKVREVLSK